MRESNKAMDSWSTSFIVYVLIGDKYRYTASRTTSYNRCTDTYAP